jgi:hypothetical protein
MMELTRGSLDMARARQTAVATEVLSDLVLFQPLTNVFPLFFSLTLVSRYVLIFPAYCSNKS